MASAQIPAAPVPRPSTDASLREARMLIDAGKFDRAVEMLTILVRQGNARDLAAEHEMLGYSYLRLNDPKRSLPEYTRAAAVERPSAVDLQNVAKDYVLLGDLPSAEHWALAAVEMDGLDADAWYGLGRIRFTLQRFQEAADCFQHALTLSPRSVKAENNLGLAYEGLNQTPQAEAAYRQAMAWQQSEEHPSEQPFLNLGILLIREEKLDEAQALLLKAVAIAPSDPRIREHLGQVYLQRKMLSEAQQQLEEAIKLEPKNSALHFLLGKVFHREGQEQKAKAEFSSAASLSGYKATPETD
jgi:Flp pilus assembly protein TadD